MRLKRGNVLSAVRNMGGNRGIREVYDVLELFYKCILFPGRQSCMAVPNSLGKTTIRTYRVLYRLKK